MRIEKRAEYYRYTAGRTVTLDAHAAAEERGAACARRGTRAMHRRGVMAGLCVLRLAQMQDLLSNILLTCSSGWRVHWGAAAPHCFLLCDLASDSQCARRKRPSPGVNSKEK